MASHHHLHHAHHHQPPPPTTAICCTSSYNTCCCTQTHNPYPPQPPPPPATDPLLQALASQFLQSTPPDPYSPHHNLRPKNPHHTHNAHHPKHRFRQQPPQDQLISSLLSRIEALESSLHHHSSSASHCSHSPYSRSLRDSAARVIQTHFRAFLVRRSRTLRQLKDLSFIKSAFTSLKSSISSETHLDFHAISQKSINLLLKLDSIQGGDPIVRDGKRSISRDLVRFLEFIDGVVMKRHGLSLKAVKNVKGVKNVRFGQNVNKPRVLPAKCGRDMGWDQREKIENLRDRIEKIRGFARIAENDEEDVELEGFQHDSDEDEENLRLRFKNGVLVKGHGLQPKVKKNVSFAENGNVYRVFSNSDEPVSGWDGSDSSDDHGEFVENRCSEVEEVKGIAQETEEDDEEAHTENGESPQASSDGERNPRARMTPRREDIYETRGRDQVQNEYLLFSAPLPVKMESKSDILKRNKAVKL